MPPSAAPVSRSARAYRPGRAELALNWNALLHSQIALHSLQVSDAQLQLPVSQTNGDALLLNNVALDMQFLSNDVARLDNCRGTFRGIQMDLIGGVNHASDGAHWKFLLGAGAQMARFKPAFRKWRGPCKKSTSSGPRCCRSRRGPTDGT